MKHTSIKENEIQKGVINVLSTQSILPIDESDFGNIKNIKAYQIFTLKNEDDRFDYEINEIFMNGITKLIVYTEGNNIKLKTIEYILSSIKNRFNTNVEIIYGTVYDIEDEQIKVHVFLSNENN